MPTATPTPRSTPLPPVPTAIPSGSEENPVRMVIVPASSGLSARRAARELETSLSERTGRAVEVVLADRYAEALAALCDSVGGVVNVAWLDGVSYAAAEAQACGTPLLQVERRAGRSSQAGEPIVMVANGDAGIESVADLRGATFCRLGYSDLATWLIPAIMLQTHGLDVAEIEHVVDYEDLTLLLEAVADGECDAAGVPQSAYSGARSAVRNALITLDESPPMPYSILMIPVEMPLDLRNELERAIVAMSSDEVDAEALDDLLRFERLVTVESSDLAPVRQFVAEAGLDLAVLGS
ncbi:MAG: PhnD/SsuA/transferrin family substrate-binding protein [Chloroflexota bacterium]